MGMILLMSVLLWGGVGCAPGEGKEAQENEVWEKYASTEVVSQCYEDEEGNVIVYYCCKTGYYGESNQYSQSSQTGLDRASLSSVIDLDHASLIRECKVGEWPAMLCRTKDRTYLCWTISPEYSCVIEYDAQVVSEADIFCMAESVIRS